MSVARGFINAGHFYSNLAKPIKIDMNFVVDPTNVNGLGVSSLKSNGYVRNVFMHTSATPGSNNGALNPNPLSGYAMIQMKQNFNKFIGGLSGFVSQTSGGTIVVTAAGAHLVVGTPYIIASVGTSTLANWQALGLPPGLTPTVGQCFIAIATGAGVGSGTVKAVGVSGISSIEVIGDPNLSINNSNIASNGGAIVLVQFLKPSTSAVTSALTMASYTPAGTNDGSTPPIFTGTPAVLTGSIANSGGVTTLIPAAPAALSVCSLSMYFDGSSVSVDGL